jgi:hypothetical protein
VSGNPLFQRYYRLDIKMPNGGDVITVTDSAWEPEALRITFDVVTAAYPLHSLPWTAQICIYNPNEQFSNQLLTQGKNAAVPAPAAANSSAQSLPVQQGMEVVLSAGYVNGKQGVIWDGYVLQPMFERENQTDFKVTLNCLNWLGLFSRNDVTLPVYQQAVAQSQVVADICAKSFHPIAIAPGGIPTSLSTRMLAPGKAVSGNPVKYLGDIARDNNMGMWLDNKGLLNMTNIADDLAQSSAPAQVYTPQTGIIGTPRQTQNGVDFTLLLDPTVEVKKPLMTVKIDNSSIQQLLYQVGTLPGLLAQDGTYVVLGARYRGDTRGTPWYTEVIGWNTAATKALAINLALGTGAGKAQTQ